MCPRVDDRIASPRIVQPNAGTRTASEPPLLRGRLAGRANPSMFLLSPFILQNPRNLFLTGHTKYYRRRRLSNSDDESDIHSGATSPETTPPAEAPTRSMPRRAA